MLDRILFFNHADCILTSFLYNSMFIYCKKMFVCRVLNCPKSMCVLTNVCTTFTTLKECHFHLCVTL